jgi:hypothetical protein
MSDRPDQGSQGVSTTRYGARIAYGIAGLSYGLIAAAVWLVFDGQTLEPLRTLVVALSMAWLVVPTILAVGITSPRVRLSLWGAYIGGLLLLPVVGGITLRESLMLLGIFVAGPALVIATTSATRIRGVAWFVAPALYMLAVAASVALAPILYVFLGVPWDATPP